MASKMVTQKNLLVALVLLVLIKFLLIPLFEWQEEMVTELNAKSRQLDKLDLIISNEELFDKELNYLKLGLENRLEHFYFDDKSTQIVIQREVEELFARYGLEITGFSWVIDSNDSNDSDSFIRTLRGTVYFSGTTEAMMRTFWDLSASSKLNRTVAWFQQIKNKDPETLGITTGHVTLEFFALKGALRVRDTGGSSD